MARLPDLIAFGQRHALKVGTIADLIAHRSRAERLVHRRHETRVSLDTGLWRVLIYTTDVGSSEHAVLLRGELPLASPALVRVQALTPVDLLPGGRTSLLMHEAMRMIAAHGSGAIVLLQDGRHAGMLDFVSGRRDPAPLSPGETMLRDYGIGAQILADLGVRDMVLLTNTPRQMVALEGYGLNIVGHRPIAGDAA